MKAIIWGTDGGVDFKDKLPKKISGDFVTFSPFLCNIREHSPMMEHNLQKTELIWYGKTRGKEDNTRGKEENIIGESGREKN